MLFKGHITTFSITFFYNESESETWVLFRIHIKVPMVEISTSGSFHFRRYTLRKIGFLASPKTSLKHVFQVKQS
jgi:hypothetical protein